MPIQAHRIIAILMLGAAVSAADQVESRTGTVIEGTIVSHDATYVIMKVAAGGREITRKYPTKMIHAITVGSERTVLNPRTGDAASPPSGTTPLAPGAPASGGGQADQMIKEVGSTKPAWYDQTKLNFPKTLDLSWPQPPPTKGWQPQLNVGQYIWTVINENEGRWKEGVRFMYHMMDISRSDKEVFERSTTGLASMYFRFFQDYPRAAYWWEQSDVKPGHHDAVSLAECYWRMGDKSKAVKMLNANNIGIQAIKLWGDMGETEKATDLADRYVKAMKQSKLSPHQAWILAGDACRKAGDYTRAMKYYQVAVDTPTQGDQDRANRHKNRAAPSLTAVRLIDRAVPGKVPDGTYSENSLGFSGPVHVEVKVAGGRIESVKVTKHVEKQYYSSIVDTTRQILEKQSVQGIDGTSSATLTSEAILNATAKALANNAR